MAVRAAVKGQETDPVAGPAAPAEGAGEDSAGDEALPTRLLDRPDPPHDELPRVCSARGLAVEAECGLLANPIVSSSNPPLVLFSTGDDAGSFLIPDASPEEVFSNGLEHSARPPAGRQAPILCNDLVTARGNPHPQVRPALLHGLDRLTIRTIGRSRRSDEANRRGGLPK